MSGPRYVVRDVPRGPGIGWVRNMMWRDWSAACESCETVVSGNTRPAAERALRAHVHRIHWSPR